MEHELFFLDGAMGTMLQAAGLELGQRPEILCLTAPETVAEIHRQYLAAGSQILYANSFSANRHKLEGTGYTVEQVVAAAIGVAKQAAAGTGARVALDWAPLASCWNPWERCPSRRHTSCFGKWWWPGNRPGRT